LPPTPDDPTQFDERLRGADPGKEPPLKPPTDTPVQAAPPPPPAPEATRPAEETRPEINVPTSGRPGQWVIQLTAVKNRASATQIVQRLIDKGHPAYLQNPAPGAPTIYRVRVGGFRDRREAENLAQRLQKEEQFSPVVTTR
jgi:cell division septation protein DedD